MKIKDNYVLQTIVDEYLVVPIAEEADRLHGVIKLNKAGAFLWNLLEKGVESEAVLEEKLSQQFGVELEKAKNDVEIYLKQLNQIGCLE